MEIEYVFDIDIGPDEIDNLSKYENSNTFKNFFEDLIELIYIKRYEKQLKEI